MMDELFAGFNESISLLVEGEASFHFPIAVILLKIITLFVVH
jgi:hypothetical protein